MDDLILQVLDSLASGGGIYCHSDHAEVYPVYAGCTWEAYTIELGLFWTLYMGGLITEHYAADTFAFEFYDISDAGHKMLRPPVKRESWQSVNDRWTVIQ